jgi:hypothetical protein
MKEKRQEVQYLWNIAVLTGAGMVRNSGEEEIPREQREHELEPGTTDES